MAFVAFTFPADSSRLARRLDEVKYVYQDRGKVRMSRNVLALVVDRSNARELVGDAMRDGLDALEGMHMKRARSASFHTSSPS